MGLCLAATAAAVSFILSVRITRHVRSHQAKRALASKQRSKGAPREMMWICL
jgi:hypothetical protein